MKIFTVTAALGMLFAMTSASAEMTHYVLEVQGLKCAFCAYNATEQLARAGFRLVEIQTTAVPEDEHTIDLKSVMQLAIDLSDRDESRFGPVLEALGSVVAVHGGQVRVHAPASMEKVLVKSLLMGKPVTVPVRFELSPSQTNAVVEWQQPFDLSD